MKALIVTSEYYGAANRIGSHHLARQFAEDGIEVFVVSFPVSPLYFFNSIKTQYPKRKAFSHGFVETEKNIKAYVPNSIIPPVPVVVKHLPFVLNQWHRFTLPNIRRVITNELGSSVDLVLTDSVFFPFLSQIIQSGTLVFRVPDFLPGFWGDNKSLLSSETTLLAQADLVVTSSRLLQKKMIQERSVDAKFLANGVSVERFELEMPIPVEYRQSNRPRAVYVGALKKWFDLDLLTRLAESRPGWDFHIIGDQTGLSHSTGSPNIHFLGEKNQRECVSYIQHANAGIIPFKHDLDGLVSHVNPIKLYEYLACGIPVISTRWKELELTDAPISIADSASVFGKMLDESLSTTPTDIRRRKSFAGQFDWNNIAKSLLKMIASS